MFSKILAGVFCIILSAALSACQPVINMSVAPDAHNPACASVMILLPNHINELPQHETNAQATSAWGEPATVELRCGVEPPPPTSDRCVAIDGVDWIILDNNDSWTFTTYGRKPAVEVTLRNRTSSGITVLSAFSPAVRDIQPYTSCLSLEDTR